jgi:hypothetical protein
MPCSAKLPPTFSHSHWTQATEPSDRMAGMLSFGG